ncbi:maestro heat-like repeat-containing protein family member 7 [Heliangelus exortis]|uniref:maestro heat-like repeat-containing protein family member 7 n=1 Tax=Heliangelus exortis TaxID=472823 RepID=UPI003A93A362
METAFSLTQARKMKVLLMDLLEVLQQGSKDVQLKALRICRKVMGELTREEASSIAVELLDKLLPLFDNGLLSELREISISLFTELLKKVAGKCKRQMRNQVRRGLLPLWFHMSDDTQSVAEASSQALLDAAEFLKWQQLQHVVRTEQMWRIGECLLLQDRTRAEDYLDQSLGYLHNAQASVRMEAIRFIGEPQPLRTLFWQPGPSPHCCPGTRSSRVAARAPHGCPVQGLGLPLPALPTQGGLVAALPSATLSLLVFRGLSPAGGEEVVQPRRPGLAARGQSQQKLSETISALQHLKYDSTPSIRCLATQTTFILSCVRVKAKPGSTKRPWRR